MNSLAFPLDGSLNLCASTHYCPCIAPLTPSIAYLPSVALMTNSMYAQFKRTPTTHYRKPHENDARRRYNGVAEIWSKLKQLYKKQIELRHDRKAVHLHIEKSLVHFCPKSQEQAMPYQPRQFSSDVSPLRVI